MQSEVWSRCAAGAVLALASLLASCGGGGGGGSSTPPGGTGVTPTPTPVPTATSKPTPTAKPTTSPSPSPTPTAIPTGGPVQLSPPAITFTQSGPTDYLITVTGGSGTYEVPSGGDSCTISGIAEWQQEPSQLNVYDVSYGSVVGSCTIKFADVANPTGNYAILQVTNDHNPH